MKISGISFQPQTKKKGDMTGESLPTKKLPFKQSNAYLIIVNLFPLVCVLAFQWSIAPIMFLYWSENIIVGFINVLKMRRAQGKVSSNVRMNGRPVQETDRKSTSISW